MSKYTKGPWLAAAKPSSIVGWPVVAPRDMGRSICNVTTGHEDSEGNALLIAAAPELLAALKRLSRLYQGIYVTMSDGEMTACRDAWVEADAAIARAEGGS